MLTSVGYTGSNAIADGYVKVVASPSGAVVQIDPDGTAGAAVGRPLIVLRGISVGQALNASNFVF